jgi:hypothetical protein
VTKPMILISILSFTTACIDVDDQPETDEVTSEIDLFTGPPPNGPNVVRVSSAALIGALFQFNGTKLSVDTTRTAEPIQVFETFYTWPNQASREVAQAECRADYSGSELMSCLQQVNADLPNISESHQTLVNKYSYVDFLASGATKDIQDIAFTVDPIHKVSSLSDIDIDIHWIHNDPNSNFVSAAAFEGVISTAPSAVFTLPLVSASPTLYCHRGTIGCPDINLSNMKVTTRLTTIVAGEPMHCPNNAGTAPYACTQGDPIGAKIGFGTVVPTFSFNRNLVGIPDVVITALVDVDAKIKDAFESKLKTALDGSGRSAISSLLTSIALDQAKNTHGGMKGFSRIRGTWFDPSGGGQLVVQYDWY